MTQLDRSGLQVASKLTKEVQTQLRCSKSVLHTAQNSWYRHITVKAPKARINLGNAITAILWSQPKIIISTQTGSKNWQNYADDGTWATDRDRNGKKPPPLLPLLPVMPL
uniref:Uncharacterized protein n=1 Tax=Eutreptiella gymnastica TaxID=73025 RepID=A0A7S1JGH7_9EUGL